MKLFTLIFSALIGFSSVSSSALAAPQPPRPTRGGEGIPWPLGEQAPTDVWFFVLAGDQFRIDIRKDKYVSGQWTYDVRLTNLTKKTVIGRGMGVYNENFYSFAVRDVQGRFYQFSTVGQGDTFTVNLTIYTESNMDLFQFKTTRSLIY